MSLIFFSALNELDVMYSNNNSMIIFIQYSYSTVGLHNTVSFHASQCEKKLVEHYYFTYKPNGVDVTAINCLQLLANVCS